MRAPRGRSAQRKQPPETKGRRAPRTAKKKNIRERPPRGAPRPQKSTGKSLRKITEARPQAINRQVRDMPYRLPGPAACDKRVQYTAKEKRGEEKKKKSIHLFSPNRKTRAESHAIDATRHLCTLQYPVWNLSRLQMIHGSSNLALLCAPRECVWSWPEGYRNFNR